MARISTKTIRELGEADLRDKISETRAHLAKLRVDGAKGILRKESGKLKPLRRDIARMLTRLNEVKK
ncbi:MAG: 50S ribosomal protein L29 [Nitrosopumilus sp. B06]|nr:MAG: 50S ribosomal protein L29 [Nitrosopumilus sp. D6]RNJ80369.1 MAG: 50S ribosomal protein L29 [Nitrosopumilus sp. B06]